MKTIGTYRWCWAGGQTPLYTRSPYYAIRPVYLAAIKREAIQILVRSLGGLAWINVKRSDLVAQ